MKREGEWSAMTDREKQILLIAQDFGMRLMLQAALRTDDRDELHDLAGQWYAMSLRAFGLKHDPDPALLDEIDEALGGALPVSARAPQDRN
jgi:hypothetical protein